MPEGMGSSGPLSLERTQEVQEILFRRCRQVVEVVDDAIGFRATVARGRALEVSETLVDMASRIAIGMRLDGLQQV